MPNPPPPTPGQRAYTAYVRVRYAMPQGDATYTYAHSVDDEQAAWEAVAQAVLAAFCASARQQKEDTPGA